MLTINKMSKGSYQIAKKKGWWPRGRVNIPEKIALMHSELSECLEEYRKGTPVIYFDKTTGKPEGMLIELADAVIRIGDLCGKMRWNLETAIKLKTRYNLTRPFKHGGKKC